MKISKVIEMLKQLNDDDYIVSINVEPIVNEFINWNGKGQRFTKYRREIIIEDKKEKVDDIDKKVW